MFRRFGESFVELWDVMFFQETIGIVFGLNVMETEFVGGAALERLIHPLASSPGLWGVSRDHADSKFI